MISVAFSSLNDLWANLIVEELVRGGATQFFLSPGSRNAPLVVAVARHHGAQFVMHFDERGSAFQAAAWAGAARSPAVLICTSGTAAANYLPAIIEASMDMVPLIVLTADRPPELHETGANQTIPQSRLYQEFVRWSFDVPCPDPEVAPEFVLTTIDQAVYRARSSAAGPVHINCRFREPLAPIGPIKDYSEYLMSVERWLHNHQPYTRYNLPCSSPTALTAEAVADVIRKTERGLLIVGRLHSDTERDAILSLARHLAWPVLPDIASGLRLGVTGEIVIPYYDLLLDSENPTFSQPPTGVIHFGGVPTSKRVQQLIERARPEHYLLVADHPCRQDPSHRITLRVEADIPEFCALLCNQVKPQVASTWQQGLIHASSAIHEALRQTIDDDPVLSEPAVARMVSQHIRRDAGLFLANSMPVREADMFADPTGPTVIVGCNRGASGIDGTIASAAGLARAINQPVTLLIGDLAFLHDLNSLALLSSWRRPFTIVLINNNGGGIFSMMPIAAVEDVFESVFGTPHGFTFETTARQFGLAYHTPATKDSFRAAYEQSQHESLVSLIEVQSDRRENFRIHEEIHRKVRDALKRMS
ncbi:MAG TPA: 2-succinyl-5-enolpyruvyl-6-hydroxy-3-cyclohexene-1-carboxylic-acid synthase [Candidatus Deferrimicrobium sp.]|nr:2-succinyl-5-enolpyruvyl-6-hydroxy-3-cyclohexene-1-carboxylic-acid synthase [Candidatus Deferrimicrobium sp.]